MKIGTKSVLFGAHQFLLHPLFLAVAWWQLYGFPWDPRLWVAFFVHDLGYLGKPNMDGPEGEQHPWLGAQIMGWLFDRDRISGFLCPHPQCEGGLLTNEETDAYIPPDGAFACPVCEPIRQESKRWHDFTLYHSRFMARRHDQRFSRLCVADKLASAITPTWLYLALTSATGELHEYMSVALNKEGGKYEAIQLTDADPRSWNRAMRDYLRRWAMEHRDGRQDTWTPARTESEAAS